MILTYLIYKKVKEKEDIQKPQLLQLSQWIRYSTSEIVKVQIQTHQIWQVPKLTWDWPTDSVTVKFPVIGNRDVLIRHYLSTTKIMDKHLLASMLFIASNVFQDNKSRIMKITWIAM